MQADILRDKFLDFFKSKEHKIVDSDSLVPQDDPTVLFTPAGMNQFKKEFMGFDSGFKRAATSQRCLRTDDLDKVGKTSAHHTLFEMLGNFSFGDYFKEEAISWAWEFLTQELKINKDKLWVSVYKDDDEAYNIWRDKIGLAAARIFKLGDKDNFWPAEAKTKGPNGPCGPCSEIFYDFGTQIGCAEKACDLTCSCGRFVEIWNLVFTQFNRKGDGSLEPLPNKNIDTGMGLERLTAVMEGKLNNFETELFQPIIKEIRRNKGESSLERAVGVSDNELFYAIADHTRAVVFSIYDGIFPSNEGRGYVVRKIIRKAVAHLRALGIDKPFMNKLVPLVAQIMHKPYPELTDKQEDIAQIILNEEDNFINTLSLSSVLVVNEIDKVRPELEIDPKKDGYIYASTTTSGVLGISAFRLYDTNGIPLEITKAELNKNKIRVKDNFDLAFQEELNKQKDLSKSFSKMKGDVFDVKGLGFKLKATEFLGYKDSSIEAKVMAILKDGQESNEISAGESGQIALNRSCFYAESGGQVGDTGELINKNNTFAVMDTKKIDNVFLHVGKMRLGVLSLGDTVTAKLNIERRQRIARNHTATHILQAALRKVLGTHVQQQGSLVSDEKLRFDFTHFKALTKDELARVEEIANNYISDNHAVEVNEMSLKEAKETKALAFFGEKYADKVRVVSVGGISKEFCGGAHISNTAEIGLIKISQEGSVASGIRRIEALTADSAKKYIEENEKKIAEEALRKSDAERLRETQKLENARKASSIRDSVPKVIEKGLKLGGVNFISSLEEGLDIDSLRTMIDMIKEKASQSVITLGSQDKASGRAFLVIGITEDLLSRGFDASVMIRQVSGIIGGSGGGRSDFAQAGGSKPENLALALEELRKVINK